MLRQPARRKRRRTTKTPISPSQVQVFDRECELKWAFDKILGLPKKPNKHARFGTRTHKVAELWLSKRVKPNVRTKEGRCFAQGAKHWPKPGTATLRTEVKFNFRWDGVEYHGITDVLCKLPQARGYVLVGDHKTTGDFKWAKTEEDLKNDPQFLTYAVAHCIATPAPGVVGRWVYYNRNRPQTRKVELAMSREEVWARFTQNIHPAAKAVTRAYEEPIEKRKPNTSMCKAYGGCDYLSVCPHAKKGATLLSITSQYFRSNDRKPKNEDENTINIDGDVPMGSALMSHIGKKKSNKKTGKKTSRRSREEEPEEDEDDEDEDEDEEDEDEEDEDEEDDEDEEEEEKPRTRKKTSKKAPKKTSKKKTSKKSTKKSSDGDEPPDLNEYSGTLLYHVGTIANQLNGFDKDEALMILDAVAAVFDRS